MNLSRMAIGMAATLVPLVSAQASSGLVLRLTLDDGMTALAVPVDDIAVSAGSRSGRGPFTVDAQDKVTDFVMAFRSPGPAVMEICAEKRIAGTLLSEAGDDHDLTATRITCETAIAGQRREKILSMRVGKGLVRNLATGHVTRIQ